jgi:hypothetical protein
VRLVKAEISVDRVKQARQTVFKATGIEERD